MEDRQDTMDTLEALIDHHGLDSVLDTLAEVCQMKADHVRANWQDEGLAREWDAMAESLSGLEASGIP